MIAAAEGVWTQVSATSDLRAEHLGVKRMLSVMDAMAERVSAGERVGDDDLTQVIEFLRVFVDRCHHAKEEELLFPAMTSAGLTEDDVPFQRLLTEHESGRRAVIRLETAGDITGRDAGSASKGLAAAIVEYATLLRAHIVLEEAACFDVADSKLSRQVQEDLAEGYDRIERERIGEGRHEGFHALLDRLEQTW